MMNTCNENVDLEICRMEEFDWSKCNESLMSSKLVLGHVATVDGIKKAGNMSGDVEKFCRYFTEKKLIGFLSANPGSYNFQDVVEFLNNSRVLDGRIKSSVKGTAIEFGLKEFADIFELPYEGEADVDIKKELLIPMYLANKAEGEEVAFGYSMLRKYFNHSYSILAHIFITIVDGRVGGFDQLTRARMSMMYHVYTDTPFNWGKYIFGRLLEEVNAFRLKKVDGLYTPVKRIGFGLRILCILKHFNVAFSEHKSFGKGRFFGETCTFGKSKRKTPAQLSEKDVAVKRLRGVEKVPADVEEESVSIVRASRSVEVEPQDDEPLDFANVIARPNKVDEQGVTDQSSSEAALKFQDIKGFEEFRIFVNGEALDTELPAHIRMKYYQLCSVQNKFLHEHLVGGMDIKSVAAMISDISSIADAMVAISISTPVHDLERIDITLQSYEDKGMAVGYLRADIRKLILLSREHQTIEESSRAKLEEINREKNSFMARKSEIDELVSIALEHGKLIGDLEANLKAETKKLADLSLIFKEVTDKMKTEVPRKKPAGGLSSPRGD